MALNSNITLQDYQTLTSRSSMDAPYYSKEDTQLNPYLDSSHYNMPESAMDSYALSQTQSLWNLQAQTKPLSSNYQEYGNMSSHIFNDMSISPAKASVSEAGHMGSYQRLSYGDMEPSSIYGLDNSDAPHQNKMGYELPELINYPMTHQNCLPTNTEFEKGSGSDVSELSPNSSVNSSTFLPTTNQEPLDGLSKHEQYQADNLTSNCSPSLNNFPTFSTNLQRMYQVPSIPSSRPNFSYGSEALLSHDRSINSINAKLQLNAMSLTPQFSYGNTGPYWSGSNAAWGDMLPRGFQSASYGNPMLGPGGHGGNKKVYSFVTMNNTKTKKRHRRKFDEIERVYQCSHMGCDKSYGTLNNLNAHILMQRHGPKRSAFEFKNMFRKINKK